MSTTDDAVSICKLLQCSHIGKSGSRQRCSTVSQLHDVFCKMVNARITYLVETEYIPHVLEKLILSMHQQFTQLSTLICYTNSQHHKLQQHRYNFMSRNELAISRVVNIRVLVLVPIVSAILFEYRRKYRRHFSYTVSK